MITFHGASLTNALKVVQASGSFSGRGLYVTDTAERAARYANARATGAVSQEYAEQAEHTVILSIEVTEAVRWSMRPADHPTLDQCETQVRSGTVIAAAIRECDYWNCTCHEKAEMIRSLVAQGVS